MMLSIDEIRLRIVEAVLPGATRIGLNQPETIIKTCAALEQYVREPDTSGMLTTKKKAGRKPATGRSQGANSSVSDLT